MQLADRLVKFVVHSFLPGSADSVLDVIEVAHWFQAKLRRWVNRPLISLGGFPAP